MKTALYLVRHGEVFNPKNVWYGRLPRYRLSKHGREEIAQTAMYLQTQNIHELYASPVLRARQTAQIIQHELHLPIHFSKSLMEIQSSLQGTPFEEIKKRNYDVFAGPTKPDIIGETIDDVANRVYTFVQKLMVEHPGKRIVAVSHGDPVMLVKAVIEGLPIKNESLRPGPEKYVHHGEVFQIEENEDKKLTIRSVFKPKS
jgi:broad specificity phosphatase PhoE